MGSLTVVNATDEDVILEAPADFSLLCPKDQRLAWGVDGCFTPEDRWTLQSTSVDFEAQGLVAGHVVQLLGPSANYKPPGEALVVESVSGKTLVLRRKGQLAGIGQPPGSVEGVAGVEFVVTTLGPQIERASEDVGRRLGMDAGGYSLAALPVSDQAAVRDVVVLTVLCRQYMAMSREMGSSQDGYAAKAEFLKAQLDERLARLVVHVGGDGDSEPTNVSRFTTRIGR